MPNFAVTYQYVEDQNLVNEIRPIHREWLTAQLAAGSLLASGPMVNRPAALLIWNAESIDALSELLEHDPFAIAGAIDERTIEEWNTVFGPWS
ncbi:MAG: hypothetical protein RLZZ380_782 [Actinomycetota bacterium]|jgi:uncharacterized protein YciI